jgi:nucleoside phosphorylase
MPQEIRPLLRSVGPIRKDGTGGFRCCWFGLDGLECVVVESGVGFARATRCARALLSAWRPDLVVSFGIAGAPRKGLTIGDVVVARDVRRLEAGLLGPVRPLASLPDAALQAAAEAVRKAGARLSLGSVVTTRGEQAISAADSGVENVVLEMETAGIADACAEAGVRLLGVRAISDSVEEPLPFSLPDYLDERQHLLIGKFVAAILRRPALLPSLLRVGRNAQRAADNAAAAARAAVRALIRR